MTPFFRTYVTLRSLIRWLMPGMSAVAAWPLLWLGLQDGGGAVYLIFFLLLMSVGPLVLTGESDVQKRGGALGSVVAWSSYLLQSLTVLFLFLFSLRSLSSLIYFGSADHGGFLTQGVLLGLHTAVYILVLWLTRFKRAQDFLYLLVWLILVVLGSSLMLYNFQLPVFPDAFQSYVYPRWESFRVSDVLWILGLSLFSLGVGWGFKQRPTKLSPLKPYHYSLWVFFWTLALGLLTVPYVFQLNFATSSFDTLLSHLPMVFPHLPAGHFAGKSLLLIFYLGSFFVSILILTKGKPKKPGKWALKVLAAVFVVACGIWLWGAGFDLDGYFKVLAGGAYLIYASLVAILWLILRSKKAL